MTEAAGTDRMDDPMAIRVAIADDEDTVVDVLRALIGSDPALRFIGAARDAEHAIELVAKERPDVVLMDVRMPGGGGLRAVREIARRDPGTKVVALSAHDDPNTVIGMIGAGAAAYVHKTDSTEKILREIHRSVDGTWSRARATPHLSLVTPAITRRDERGSRVAQAILDGAVTAEFQPIVDIETAATVGLDVHPRVATLPHRSYDAWIADARAIRLLEDFELAALRASLQVLPLVPEHFFVEFEVSPTSACSGRFRQSIKRPMASRIVLGFTPSVMSDDTEPGGPGPGDAGLEHVLGSLRERGARVSAREVGPGLAGLRHLSYLSAEFARLDPTLTRSIGHSFSSHSVVAAVAAFASEAGAKVIATDVASERQRDELAALGVHYVEGPLVGGPLHLSELRAEPGRWNPGLKGSTPGADDGEGKVASPGTSWGEGGDP